MDGNVSDPSGASSMNKESPHQKAAYDAAIGDGRYGRQDGTNQQYPWYQQPQYCRFWQHYAAMQSWMQMYVVMHKNPCTWSPSAEYQYITNRYGWWSQFPTSSSHGYQVPQRAYSLNSSWSSRMEAYQYAGHSPHYQNTASQQGTQDDKQPMNTAYSDEETEDSDDESLEVEISQEMLEFFRTSQKFREERDKAKLEREKRNDGSKTKRNPLRLKEKNKCQAPSERPDEGRRKGMKVLYGKHSARIHSMETAMQMQFDRNCDRHQPAFWPIVALRM
ncbi:gem-associated protein 8-like [Acanthaster planci]|uniref:Gem-associated protein 8-like n=1 Tax=Acanthaster planci TaxID=133434 RepID=A0A8B7ZVD3_ACAPL|nr:gem-associated protein 8-like [Acanthaster planci]